MSIGIFVVRKIIKYYKSGVVIPPKNREASLILIYAHCFDCIYYYDIYHIDCLFYTYVHVEEFFNDLNKVLQIYHNFYIFCSSLWGVEF